MKPTAAVGIKDVLSPLIASIYGAPRHQGELPGTPTKGVSCPVLVFVLWTNKGPDFEMLLGNGNTPSDSSKCRVT